MRARAWYAVVMLTDPTAKLLANNIDYKVKDNDLKGAASLFITYEYLLTNYISDTSKKAIDKYINDLTEKG